MQEVHRDQEVLVQRGEDAVSSVGDNSPVEWRGLPAFVKKEKPPALVISFDSEEERDALIAELGIVVAKKTGTTHSGWYPPRAREDLASLRFDFGDDDA